MGRNFNSETTRLILGLGNPGDAFKNTFHNVGVLFLEYLLKTTTGNASELKKKKKISYRELDLYKIVFPTTFMNESGTIVSFALSYFKIPADSMLVVHDDSDISLGNFKLSFGRGAAGHKGIISILSHTKSKDFWRLRIGIRPNHPSLKRPKAEEFVLKQIGNTEKRILEDVFLKIKKRYFSNL